MSDISTPAILLRRIEHGEADYIVTLLTRDIGKVSAIAKNAKKSVKRFPGSLELFSHVEALLHPGRNKGLYLLMEADLIDPFAAIRMAIEKTAYAGFFSELVHRWLEEESPQPDLFELLAHTLAALCDPDAGDRSVALLFLVRFASLSGLGPNFSACRKCRLTVEEMEGAGAVFDIQNGGVICSRCAGRAGTGLSLSKGSLKQLAWASSGGLDTARRVRFTEQSLLQGLAAMEAFLPYHLGKTPRSLQFLQQIRKRKTWR